jgi:hypothetical protein
MPPSPFPGRGWRWTGRLGVHPLWSPKFWKRVSKQKLRWGWRTRTPTHILRHLYHILFVCFIPCIPVGQAQDKSLYWGKMIPKLKKSHCTAQPWLLRASERAKKSSGDKSRYETERHEANNQFSGADRDTKREIRNGDTKHTPLLGRFWNENGFVSASHPLQGIAQSSPPEDPKILASSWRNHLVAAAM